MGSQIEENLVLVRFWDLDRPLDGHAQSVASILDDFWMLFGDQNDSKIDENESIEIINFLKRILGDFLVLRGRFLVILRPENH